VVAAVDQGTPRHPYLAPQDSFDRSTARRACRQGRDDAWATAWGRAGLHGVPTPRPASHVPQKHTRGAATEHKAAVKNNIKATSGNKR
jgi:hypothetical protein